MKLELFTPQPDQTVCRLLEQLLSSARRGEICEICVATRSPGNMVGEGYAGEES